jgi:hypothetical protein
MKKHDGVFYWGLIMKGDLLVTLLLILNACTWKGKYDETLVRADSLMNEYPDSALQLLEAMSSDSSSFNKKDRMRWLLLKAKAQNKAFAPMPSDSAFLDVVRYYNQYGRPNDRVLAHYLYGCIARDRNDAPQTLERYMEATALADTTSADCDYTTLLAVYSQMADIYYQQNLPKEEIQALKKAGECSLKAGDVRNYIRSVELMVRPYYALDDTAGILNVTSHAHDLYLKNGFRQEAASVYPSAIFIYLKQGKYKEAKVLMDEFERYSGLFKNGEIKQERRQYEYSRGMYYEGVGQMDSAEYHYRKVLFYGYPFEGYKGLLSLYSKKGMTDSVRKYAPLYLQSVDDMNAKLQTEAVMNMRSLYDYTKSKKLAEEQKRKTDRLRSVLLMLLMTASVIFVTGVLLYRSYKKRKNLEISKLSYQYEQSLEKLDEREEEVMELKAWIEAAERARKQAMALLMEYPNTGESASLADDDEMVRDIRQFVKEMGEMARQREKTLSEKSKEIEKLTKQNKSYERQLREKGCGNAMIKLKDSKIVTVFKSFASKPDSRKPTEKDWEGLYKTFEMNLPTFFIEIKDMYGLSPLELQATLLMCLGFSNVELCGILEKSSQRVTNIKADVNQKIFNDKKASSLRRNLMQKLNSL